MIYILRLTLPQPKLDPNHLPRRRLAAVACKLPGSLRGSENHGPNEGELLAIIAPVEG